MASEIKSPEDNESDLQALVTKIGRQMWIRYALFGFALAVALIHILLNADSQTLGLEAPILVLFGTEMGYARRNLASLRALLEAS